MTSARDEKFEAWMLKYDTWDPESLERTETDMRYKNNIVSFMHQAWQASRADLTQLVRDYREAVTALQSIGANTCCENCQEAKLVANSALRKLATDTELFKAVGDEK